MQESPTRVFVQDPVTFTTSMREADTLTETYLLRELLSLPPGTLSAPIFRKLSGYLKNYREGLKNGDIKNRS